MSLKIKICGMREPENIIEVSELKPELMGFIFYTPSPRYVGNMLNIDVIAKIPAQIRKTGVFVNADYEEIISTVRKYSLNIVQLHGNETPDACHRIKETGIQVIKAFNIQYRSAFKVCSKFINYTDYFLFDTLSPNYGGSGKKFDWKILGNYDLEHPFFLSGGISPEDVNNILDIANPSFYGIDLNSKFEIKSGLKNFETLKKFFSDIR